jgi:hypothetical protein
VLVKHDLYSCAAGARNRTSASSVRNRTYGSKAHTRQLCLGVKQTASKYCFLIVHIRWNLNFHSIISFPDAILKLCFGTHKLLLFFGTHKISRTKKREREVYNSQRWTISVLNPLPVHEQWREVKPGLPLGRLQRCGILLKPANY